MAECFRGVFKVHRRRSRDRNAKRKPFQCPVCYNWTIEGDYDICTVCWWEWDGIEKWPVKWHKKAAGPNKTGLIQARKNYVKFGCSVRRFIRYARKPHPLEKNRTATPL